MKFQKSWTSVEWLFVECNTVWRLLSLKGSSSIRNSSGYKPRSHQKGLRKRLMPENDKTGTVEESFTLYCVNVSKRWEERVWDFQESFVECSNISEASGEEHPFVEWFKESRESNPHFFRWESSHYWSCQHQTEWLGCNVWERCMWTPQSVNNQAPIPNHDAWHYSIERKEYASGLAWTGFRVTSAAYKEILKTEVLPWVKNITKNSDYVFSQDEVSAHTAKTVQDMLKASMSFDPKPWASQSQDLNPLDFSLWILIEEKACKTRHSNTNELKASVNRAW